MRIPSVVVNLDWWKAELRDHPEKHMGPACIMGATTAIVMAVWGKYHALSFVTVATLTYPFSHHQIEYLMYLDVHETAFAVAIVGIQLFNMQFPLLSQISLFMSVALAASLMMRGIKIRQIMQEHKNEIAKQGVLMKKLTTQVDELAVNSSNFEKVLQKLTSDVLKKSDLVQIQSTAEAQKEAVVIEIEKDYTALNEQLKLLTSVCEKLIEEKGVAQQLAKMDENAQEIAKQAALIQANNEKLEVVIEDLRLANAKFNDLLLKAQQDEEQVQAGLKELCEWLTTLPLKHPGGL